MTSAGPYYNLHLATDITTPASHHSIFYRQDLLPRSSLSCCPFNSVRAL